VFRPTILWCLLLLPMAACPPDTAQTDLTKRFQALHEKARRARHASSDWTVIMKSPPYLAIRRLGFRALPLMMKTDDPVLHALASDMVGVPHVETIEIVGRENGRPVFGKEKYPDVTEILAGRQSLRGRFEEAHWEWRSVLQELDGEPVLLETQTVHIEPATGEKTTGSRWTPAGKAYDEMRKLTRLIVPLLVEKVLKEFDMSVIPLLEEMTQAKFFVKYPPESPEGTRKRVLEWRLDGGGRDYYSMPEPGPIQPVSNRNEAGARRNGT